MVKGTPSRGKHHKTQVIICRRCGSRSFSLPKKRCSACGFGNSSKIRKYGWRTKVMGTRRIL